MVYYLGERCKVYYKLFPTWSSFVLRGADGPQNLILTGASFGSMSINAKVPKTDVTTIVSQLAIKTVFGELPLYFPVLEQI